MFIEQNLEAQKIATAVSDAVVNRLLDQFPDLKINRIHDEISIERKPLPDKRIPMQPFIWRMKNGCEIRMCDFDYSHLVKTVALIRLMYRQGNLLSLNGTPPQRDAPTVFRPQYQDYGLYHLVNLFKEHGYKAAFGGKQDLSVKMDEEICSKFPIFAHLLLELMRRGI